MLGEEVGCFTAFELSPLNSGVMVRIRFRLMVTVVTIHLVILLVTILRRNEIPPSVEIYTFVPSWISPFRAYFVSPPKLHFLIPAHSSNFEFCQCIRTHLINGYSPILVNYGHDMGHERENKYAKLAGVGAYLSSTDSDGKPVVGPNDIIAVMDGFDLWSQLPPSVFIQRFVASEKRIVLGVDKNCFPNDPASPVCNKIPQSPWPSKIYGPHTDMDTVGGNRDHTRPRWVNSGIVIGYASDLIPLYKSMTVFRQEHPDQDSGDSDQRVFAIHYWWNKFPIQLDFNGDFGVSVAFTTHDLKFMTDPGYSPSQGIQPWIGDHGEYIPRTPVLRNAITDIVPVFIHFPGVAKPLMRNWNTRLWWSLGVQNATEILNQYVMEKQVTLANNISERLTFRSICDSQMERLTREGREPGDGPSI